MAPSVDGPLLPSQPPQTVYRSKYCTQDATNTPLEWNTVAKIAPQLRELAVEQLVRNWRQYASIDGYEALWGDEIEYFLADLKQDSFARPLFDQARVLKILQSSDVATCFQPEFAKCCVETNPLSPYEADLDALLDVESSMTERRSLIRNTLHDGQAVLTMPSFPTFGLQTVSPEKIVSESAPAYTLSRNNLIARRQRAWRIHVPIFRDARTPTSSDHVLIDDFVYGSTQCCMQVTMQAKNLREARQLYDHLIPLSPIMLALTAATPIYKRQLVETDTRWNVLSTLFDDRSPEELSRNHKRRSRWSSNNTYIAPNAPTTNASDDVQIAHDVNKSLLAAGMDATLAKHFAHILSYDPIKLMTSDIEDAKDNSTKLFELFNNSCYQGVRFKPPPGGENTNDIGWRVEFRTMEVQLTDFENAAFGIFVYLAGRVIVEFNLDLHIPLSKVEENFDRANGVNAAVNEKFWFRTAQWCSGPASDDEKTGGDAAQTSHDLLTIDAIINGTGTQSRDDFQWPGFIPLVKLYLAKRGASPAVLVQIQPYLDLVSSRASGQSPTGATWMRSFVRSHPDYQGDSEVPESVVYELLKKIETMSA